MKTYVKICVLFLLLISVFTVTAHAESDDNNIIITSAKVTAVDENDSEKILRIELLLGNENAEGGVTDFAFDTVDTEMTAGISEFSYVYRNAIVSEYKDGGADDETVIKLCEEALIARCKAVSLAENVLTLDIFSTDSKKGAALIEIVTGIDELDSNMFIIKFPEKMFSNSTTGEESPETYTKTGMEGLEKVKAEAPYLLRVYFGEEAAFPSVLIILPLLPLSVLVFAVRYQKACGKYGFEIFKEFGNIVEFAISKIRQI